MDIEKQVEHIQRQITAHFMRVYARVMLIAMAVGVVVGDFIYDGYLALALVGGWVFGWNLSKLFLQDRDSLCVAIETIISFQGAKLYAVGFAFGASGFFHTTVTYALVGAISGEPTWVGLGKVVASWVVVVLSALWLKLVK